MSFTTDIHDMATALASQGKPLTFYDDADPNHEVIIHALNVARGWGCAVVHYACMEPGVNPYLSKVKSILRRHVSAGETLAVRYNEHEKNSGSIAFEIICRGLNGDMGENREKKTPFTKHVDVIAHTPQTP